MSEGCNAHTLSARAVWRLLNRRPGWRISLRRVYVLLEQGQIPCARFHASHNAHYSVISKDLEAWAKSVELKSPLREMR